MASERFGRLEQELLRVPGVHSALVVGDDAPREIHIVASRDRPPKQLVRDVQSLAAAGYGWTIDHRIVSVVQLLDPATAGEADTREPTRPILERVVFAEEGSSGWVKVGLRWTNGNETEGASVGGRTREVRARGAADAVVNALEPVLTSRGARIEVDHLALQRLGEQEAVVVHGFFYDDGSSTQVVGSAIVLDDVASAAVRAVLHAVNRKLG